MLPIAVHAPGVQQMLSQPPLQKMVVGVLPALILGHDPAPLQSMLQRAALVQSRAGEQAPAPVHRKLHASPGGQTRPALHPAPVQPSMQMAVPPSTGTQ